MFKVLKKHFKCFQCLMYNIGLDTINHQIAHQRYTWYKNQMMVISVIDVQCLCFLCDRINVSQRYIRTQFVIYNENIFLFILREKMFIVECVLCYIATLNDKFVCKHNLPHRIHLFISCQKRLFTLVVSNVMLKMCLSQFIRSEICMCINYACDKVLER